MSTIVEHAGIAAARGATAAQVALAWVQRRDDVIAIPKAVSPTHLAANFAALDMTLTRQELAAIDAAFQLVKRPLAMA